MGRGFDRPTGCHFSPQHSSLERPGETRRTSPDEAPPHFPGKNDAGVSSVFTWLTR
jgi:hypothetical protein